jgi:hypothetical protein
MQLHEDGSSMILQNVGTQPEDHNLNKHLCENLKSYTLRCDYE